MHPVLVTIGIGWAVFWAFWLIASFTAKASQGRWSWFSASRLGLLVLVVYLIRLSAGKGGGGTQLLPGPVPAGTGLALWIAGLALAIWARLYIGRNWGMPMTRRQDPDLVTTGPYRFIRHPIYAGILLAMIGTAVATTLFGLIAVAVIGGFFVYSATREEKFLAGQFPGTFPAYKAKTKMLIPFVFLPCVLRRR